MVMSFIVLREGTQMQKQVIRKDKLLIFKWVFETPAQCPYIKFKSQMEV